jgi:hypothetical protein
VKQKTREAKKRTQRSKTENMPRCKQNREHNKVKQRIQRSETEKAKNQNRNKKEVKTKNAKN